MSNTNGTCKIYVLLYFWKILIATSELKINKTKSLLVWLLKYEAGLEKGVVF